MLRRVIVGVTGPWPERDWNDERIGSLHETDQSGIIGRMTAARTRCTRACPAGEHMHYVGSGQGGLCWTLERQTRIGNHMSWIERVPAANRLQRWIPRLRRPKW